MKTLTFLAGLIFIFSCHPVTAQWPAEVTIVKSKANDSVMAMGDLNKGRVIDDLRWASSSSNACFVAIQNAKFRGKHVFYATSIPPHSIMYISVKPDDEHVNLSMYAYMSIREEYNLPPDLPHCITCEADFKWDRPWKGKVQTSERWVEFNNPTDGPFNILIGVSSPKNMTGDESTAQPFRLKIKVKS